MMWYTTQAIGAVLRARKGMSFVMCAVSFVATMWILLGSAYLLSSTRDIQAQVDSVQVDVILVPGLPDSVMHRTHKELRKHSGVRSAVFVDAEEVWQEFSREVGVDEELRSVVQLPSMIKLRIASTYEHSKQFQYLASTLRTHHASVVQDVVWPRALVKAVDERQANVQILGCTVAVLTLLLLGSAVPSVFRGDLSAVRADVVTTMAVGATRYAAMFPYVVKAGIICCIGVLCAFVATMVVRNTVGKIWLERVDVTELVYGTLCVAALGLVMIVCQGLILIISASRVRRPR